MSQGGGGNPRTTGTPDWDAIRKRRDAELRATRAAEAVKAMNVSAVLARLPNPKEFVQDGVHGAVGVCAFIVFMLGLALGLGNRGSQQIVWQVFVILFAALSFVQVIFMGYCDPGVVAPSEEPDPVIAALLKVHLRSAEKSLGERQGDTSAAAVGTGTASNKWSSAAAGADGVVSFACVSEIEEATSEGPYPVRVGQYEYMCEAGTTALAGLGRKWIRRPAGAGDDAWDKYCHTCHIWRPPRSAHCNTCGFCIRKYDHHCGVYGRCIGEYNFRWFGGVALCGGTSLLISAVGTLVRILDEGGFTGKGNPWGMWDVYTASFWILFGGYMAGTLLLFALVQIVHILSDQTMKKYTVNGVPVKVDRSTTALLRNVRFMLFEAPFRKHPRTGLEAISMAHTPRHRGMPPSDEWQV